MANPAVCPVCRIERTPRPGFGACPVCGERLVAPEAVTALVASPAPEEDAPRTIGRYTLDVLLGEGAMGSVWKAYDAHLKRLVALKILRGKDPQDIERLHREARIAASLRHPNIVSVHDVGSADDESFIAMDLVDGESIDRLRLSVRRVLEVVRDAARAVHYAHGRGIVHRDLKPGNLLVDREGRAYVTDFGLAKQTQIDSSMSTIGAVLGTPQFMSPEQAAGKSKEADARSDIWSLGATIYFLLCGRAPFNGTALFEILRRIQEEDPTPLRRHNPRIHGDIETIVTKCLQKEPARRYRTAAELAEDLDRFLGGEPIAARPPSTFYRVTHGLRRHKWMVVGMAFALLGAGTTYFVVKDQMRKRGAAGPLKEAEALFAQGRYVEARSRYDDARGRGGSIPEDRYARCLDEERRTQWLARREVELGPYLRRCEFAIQKAVETRKGELPAYRVWRDCVDEAIRAIDEALSKDPTWATGYIARGKAKMEGNDVDSAVADFTEALRHDPQDSLARYERGKAALGMIMNEKMNVLEGDPTASARGEVWRRKAEEDFDIGTRQGWKLEEREIRTVEVMAAFAKLPFSSSEEARRQAESLWRRTQALLEEIPNEGRLWRILAALLYGKGKTAEALEVWKMSVAVEPKTPQALYFGGALRGQLGDWEGDVEECTKAIALDPEYGIPYHGRAYAYSQLQRWKEAREDTESALARMKDYPPARNLHALATGELGDWIAAKSELDRLIEEMPDYSHAVLNRASAIGMLGDWKAAIAEFDRIESRFPDPALLYNNRGAARANLGDWKGALQDFDRALKLNPRNPQGHLNRALVFRERKEWGPVVEELTRVLELGLRNPEVYRQRGLAYRQLDDWKKALDDFDAAIRLGGTSPQTHAYRGRARRELGDWTGAIEDFTQAIDGGFASAEVHYDRARAYQGVDKHKEARADFDEAERLGFKGARLYQHRGFARGSLGDWKGALEDLTRAVDGGIDDTELFNNRGIARAQLGDWAGAADDYTRALDKDPNNLSARANRGIVRMKVGGALILRGAIEDLEKFLAAAAPDHPQAPLVRHNLDECRKMLAEIDR